MAIQKKKKWELEDISKGFALYYELNKKYPTTQEINKFTSLPSAKTIQRKFGGINFIRKQLEIEKKYLKQKKIKDRLTKKQRKKIDFEAKKEVVRYLEKYFGTDFIQINYSISGDNRSKVDFFIKYKKGEFLVDLFYSEDYSNLIGCLNSKIKKYNSKKIENLIIFLQINKNITSEDIAMILNRRKNPLKPNQKLKNMRGFRNFCKKNTTIIL